MDLIRYATLLSNKERSCTADAAPGSESTLEREDKGEHRRLVHYRLPLHYGGTLSSICFLLVVKYCLSTSRHRHLLLMVIR